MPKKQATLPDLSQHPDKFVYESLTINADTGAIYLQEFSCIIGEPTKYKGTEIVPVIFLTRPDENDAQFPSTDDQGNVKAKIRALDWKEQMTNNGAEIQELLGGFVNGTMAGALAK